MNLKEQHSQESREVILEDAIQEFGSYGFLGASTNRMCQRANISKGLLFHYYRNKETLFSGVLERCFAELRHSTDDLPGCPCGSLDYIDQFYGARLRFFLSHPNHYRILRESFSLTEESLRQLLDAKKQDLHQEKLRLFEQFSKELPLQKGVEPDRAMELMVLVSDYVQQSFMDRLRCGALETERAVQEFQKEHRAMIRMVTLGIFQIPKAG